MIKLKIHYFDLICMLILGFIEWCNWDGASKLQLGYTHVMVFVIAQLVQPYRDRPNEDVLSIYTEFSPMADPLFELGHLREFAIELECIIDHGLRY